MTVVVRPLRIASVSFLNARPLIYGLDRYPDLSVRLDVPSRLLDFLRDGSADVALLPTIDFQRMDGLSILPAGGIGCDGPTLTVRIFARQPIESIRSLAVDGDSHTSVALARIILAKRHGVRPELIDLARAKHRDDEALLLIGDKVVCEEPGGYSHQHDLGEEWKEMTGLPFVFAVWMAREGVEIGDLAERLSSARISGLAHVDELIEQFAVPRGWPRELAHRYLTDYLKFEIGDRQLQAIETFHRLAHELGVIPALKPLRLAGAGADSASSAGR